MASSYRRGGDGRGGCKVGDGPLVCAKVNAGTGQREMMLHALLDAAQDADVEVCMVAAAEDPANTAVALDAATRDAARLVILTADDGRAALHADAWACDRAGWLVLADPLAGKAVLAAVDTLAAAPLPGGWRGGRRPAAPAPDTAAISARAALVDSQRNEADRLRMELVEERAWVAAEAERVRASQAWRLGHRIVRAARRLTFRRDEGTDALGRLIERMNAPREP